ncbi:MAG: hypothetical protein OEX08_03030 [Candidatus Nomurabacteria bacterium]|nr:hypothetical protein [Candidatus Nomurabacteria bacterium]
MRNETEDLLNLSPNERVEIAKNAEDAINDLLSKTKVTRCPTMRHIIFSKIRDAENKRGITFEILDGRYGTMETSVFLRDFFNFLIFTATITFVFSVIAKIFILTVI